MPKEHKKRGRREEKKRKRRQTEDGRGTDPKWPRSQQFTEATEVKLDVPDRELESQYEPYPTDPKEVKFYGLLDEEEQAYFKRADQMLELSQFSDPEERDLFLASLWREVNGKELKIANSQSCSRLMERLIASSTPTQLKALFSKLNGHFLALVQHRFASHCCEALFAHSAPFVTREMVEPRASESKDVSEDGPSMESLFLKTVKELEGNMGYLMTDHFGSHALRVLLVVLSGRSLADASTTSLLQSKKKENNETVRGDQKLQVQAQQQRTVPDSFHDVLGQINSGMVGGLDPNYLRALALQPLANPVLQLLLEIEFMESGKQRAKDENSLFRKLIAGEALDIDHPNIAFLKGLLYDSVGSHLLETILQYAPGKSFKAIYNSLLRDDLSSIIKNETAGFVVIKTLERLSSEDLREAAENICSEIPLLVDRSRTSIIKALIERCRVRNLDTAMIAEALKAKYGEPGKATLIMMLSLEEAEVNGMAEERKAHLDTLNSSKTHASLLAQSMLESPGSLRDMIVSSFLAMEPLSLVRMAKDRSASHVLQVSLICQEQSQSFRRKLLQQFKDYATELAVDAIGSHVIDVFWKATHDLHFIRERIAEELLANEMTIKDAFSGRAVWRNWMMDVYKRSRQLWIQKSKDRQEENVSTKTSETMMPQNGEDKKSGIELARERFAAKHQKRAAFRTTDQRHAKDLNKIALNKPAMAREGGKRNSLAASG